MSQPKTCFVVMGFGEKTDYQSGRVLDLDMSYRYIIKPSAEMAGLVCTRADEIVHSGLIDVPMYEQLLTADVVIADISTSNVNAFYELGVRHALRPYTTITLAEDKMVFPFDITHLAVRKYTHMGKGIDFGEVERMRKELVKALETIVNSPQNDSPVYTFFRDLTPPVRKEIQQAIAQSAPAVTALAAGQDGKGPMDATVKDLMGKAEEARKRDDFAAAAALLKAVRTMAPNDPFVIQRLALATYKGKLPDPVRALQEARAILAELKPQTSSDPETLGLWGAIHKRLWDLRKEREDLDTSLVSYEKGFYLKDDYYNGINLAYLYNLRCSISEGDEATADAVMARRVRARVLQICDAWLEEDDRRLNRSHLSTEDAALVAAENQRCAEEKYWVLATQAEAYVGRGDEAGAGKTLDRARKLRPAGWMLESTEAQLAALRALLAVHHV